MMNMVTINRDELCTMRGKLLMLSCCAGLTITNTMVDEIINMVEIIDDALEGEEMKA